MVYSNYVKQRILYFKWLGKSYRKIVEILASEGHVVSKSGIQDFLKKVEQTGSIRRKPGSGGQSKKTPSLLQKIDRQMEVDDKSSLKEMKTVLEKARINVSISSIHRWRNELGWSSKSTKYCHDKRGQRRKATKVGTRECGQDKAGQPHIYRWNNSAAGKSSKDVLLQTSNEAKVQAKA